MSANNDHLIDSQLIAKFSTTPSLGVINQYNLTQMHKAEDHGCPYNSFLGH